MSIIPDRKLLRLSLVFFGIIAILIIVTFFSSIKTALLGADVEISMSVSPAQIRPAGAKDSLFVVKNGDRAHITVSYKNNTFQDLVGAKVWVLAEPTSKNTKQFLLISLPTETTKVNRAKSAEESRKRMESIIVVDIPDIKSKSTGLVKAFIVGRQRDTIKVKAVIRTKEGKEVSSEWATILVK